MAVSLERMASELAVAPAELQQRSLQAYVERERRLVQLDIADLQDRYGVHTAAALALRIEQKQVYAHPAWQELIEWERLEEYRALLDSWEQELELGNV